MPPQVEPGINSNDPAFLYLNLHPDETIKYIVRHHWLGFLGTLLIVLGMALFPFFILLATNLAFPDTISDYSVVLGVSISGYFLFLLTFLFGAWINFYYDIVFITSERIINVAQQGLLSRETSELSMKQVENVTADLSGFLQSAFNYGLLVVETAGEGTSGDAKRPGIKGYFTISDVPDPNRLARAILEFHRQIDRDEDSA